MRFVLGFTRMQLSQQLSVQLTQHLSPRQDSRSVGAGV